jgi:hypothetical protein
VDTLGRPGKVQLGGHCDEVLQVAQFHGEHSIANRDCKVHFSSLDAMTDPGVG